MPHPDEGTIHALLDGELTAAEAELVRAHVAECGECLGVYNEAERLLAEADGAIALLDEPRRWPLEAEDMAPDIPAPPAAGIAAGAPLVLMPGASHGPRWERPRSRSYFWAAGLAVVAGAGYLLIRAQTNAADSASRATIATLPSAVTAASDSASRALAAGPPASDAAHPMEQQPTSRVADAGRLRQAEREKPPVETPRPAATAVKAAVVRPGGQFQPVAEASADLAAAPPAATPPAAPEPSVEARAQLSSRIGLDEAKRELGSSLHGIDGLRPVVIGILAGRLVPGADPARNVVRAVYRDRNGQLFYLDQQRVAATAGAARQGGGLVVGEVQLFLHGQLSADSVRALQDRLR